MTDAAFDDYYSDEGLAALGPRVLAVKRALDAVFRHWAAEESASEWDFPPFLTEAQLCAFDYFENFPHLAVSATPTLPASGGGTDRLFLTSAACYSAYVLMADRELDRPTKVTMATRCCRNEENYNGLRRLHSFTMREVVALGDAEWVLAHLSDFKRRVLNLADHLELAVTVEKATDPFFDPNASRAVMQRVFPVKEEVVTQDGTAIASLNHHRNFFGERSRISYGGSPVHTSCAAFGLERWIDAIDGAFHSDWNAAGAAIDSFIADEVVAS